MGWDPLMQPATNPGNLRAPFRAMSDEDGASATGEPGPSQDETHHRPSCPSGPALPQELIDAARRGQLKAIAKWLRKGSVDAQCPSKEGSTLLQAAVINSQVDVVRELVLHRGADVNLPNYEGSTALMCAAETGELLEARLLLDHGADPNRQTGSGATALMTAATHGCDGVLALLLGASADIDAQTFDGETALMVAAREGKDKCVRLLLDAGASTELRSDEGKTALSIAEEKRYATTRRLLQRASAQPPASSSEHTPVKAVRVEPGERRAQKDGERLITLPSSAVRAREPPPRRKRDPARRALLAKALRD